MYSQDDIQYALEFTQILLEPDRRIDTFGSTSFEFHLISELMDSANETRVREGIIHADRPTIIKPDPYTDLEFEGFGEQAEAFTQWLHENAADLSILKYGFSFRKDKVREDIINEPFNEVRDKVIDRANESSTVSSESAPRSSTNLASGTTLSGDAPSSVTIISLTFSSILAMKLYFSFVKC